MQLCRALQVELRAAELTRQGQRIDRDALAFAVLELHGKAAALALLRGFEIGVDGRFAGDQPARKSERMGNHSQVELRAMRDECQPIRLELPGSFERATGT